VFSTAGRSAEEGRNDKKYPTNEGGGGMTNNRELAAAFGVASVAWVLIGHSIGYYAYVPAFAIWVDFVVTLLVLIFTPAVMSKARWTALGAMIAGVIKVIWHVIAVTQMPVSLLYGPVVALVLALLFTYFSFRAYQEK
jgi:hypothetical protein